MKCIKCKDDTNNLTKNNALCRTCRNNLHLDKENLKNVEMKIISHHLKIPLENVPKFMIKRITNNFVLNVYKLNKLDEMLNAYDKLIEIKNKEKANVKNDQENT